MVVINRLNWVKERLWGKKHQTLLALVLLALLCALTNYLSRFILLILGSEMIFSHLFYLPVALAGIWWGIRGIWVAVVIALAWIGAYFLSGLNVPPQEYFPQPVMFIVIGSMVGILREQNLRSEKQLRNRVKELNCLFGISKLREKPGLSLEELLQGTVILIPPAWQYPDITCARVILGDQIFSTKNFAETPWKQACDIVVGGECLGQLEVYYLEAQPEADEGPFLKEERRLLTAVAERLGKIVERERAEAALRKSELTNRALVSAIPDVMWHMRNDGTLLVFKGAKDFDVCLPAAPDVGKNVYDVLPPDIAEQTIQHSDRALQTGETQIFEYQIGLHGTAHDYEARIVVIGESEVLSIVRDITDRKAREALVEEERMRIARDLHDGLAQSLYFFGLKLDFIRKHVTRDPEGVIRELLTLKKIVQASIQDVRRTIFALRPVDLEHLGFDPAMRQYAHDFGEHMGLNVMLNVQGDAAALSTPLEIVFFRLMQEGLNNVAKHANARQVWIDLEIVPGQQGQIVIRDDGVGFDPQALLATSSGHVGLRQMHERVAMLGGRFRIESVPAQGTTLRAEIPL